MLKERREAVHSVAQCLFALEDAIDNALVHAATLTATMPSARKTAKLSAVVGQDAFALSAETISFLIKARASTVAAHASLDDTKTQIGLRELSLGDVLDKPKPPLAYHAPLRAVS